MSMANTGSAITWQIVASEWTLVHWIIEPAASLRRTACGLMVPIITQHNRVLGLHETKETDTVTCTKCIQVRRGRDAVELDNRPDFLLGLIRDTIRNAPKGKDQTHWHVPGVGTFDLNGNFLGEDSLQ